MLAFSTAWVSAQILVGTTWGNTVFWCTTALFVYLWKGHFEKATSDLLAQEGKIVLDTARQWCRFTPWTLLVIAPTLAAMWCGVWLSYSWTWDYQSPFTLRVERREISQLVGACGGVVVGYLSYRFTYSLAIERIVSNVFVRGRKLLTLRAARRVADRLRKSSDVGLPSGGVALASDSETPHFLILGATGAGKSLTIAMLLRAVLRLIVPGSDQRALINNPKGDVVPILFGNVSQCPIHLLHPFDIRSCGWRISRDCRSPASAKEFAVLLIPSQNESQPYFRDAARAIAEGIMTSFIQTVPNDWTLRDVLLAAYEPDYLRQILERTNSTKKLLSYFEPRDTFQNVLTTLQNRLSRFEPIVAAWSRATRQISLEDDWLKTESVIVLGADESVREALEAINAFLIQRSGQLILSQPDSKSRRTWVVLDEVREMGKLNGLSRLMTNGRSKGARVLLGLQDIEGLRDVYGNNVANEIVGMCANKAIFRLESAETAHWASEVLGDQEIIGRQHGNFTPQGSVTGGLHQSDDEQSVVLPSEFLTLPYPTPSTGLTGIYVSANIGAWKATLSGKEVADGLPTVNSRVPSFVPRPIEHQYLLPWTNDDLKRLGLKLKGP